MFSEDKITEIFCLADEFCKFFDTKQEKTMLSSPTDGKHHRRKPNRMSDAEIIVILIHFHSGAFRCFKHYYLHYICKHCKHLFPNIANALSAIVAYCFFEKLPVIDVEFINDGQLSLF